MDEAGPSGRLVVSGHAVSPRLYLLVFLALLALTLTTVAAAFQDLGPLNTPVALGIAVLKALLVVLYFMHVRWSRPLTWIVAAAAFLWLALLVGGTLVDVLSRSWIPAPPV